MTEPWMQGFFVISLPPPPQSVLEKKYGIQKSQEEPTWKSQVNIPVKVQRGSIP